MTRPMTLDIWMISIDIHSAHETQLLVHVRKTSNIHSEAWDVASLKDKAHDIGHLNDLDRHSAHETQRLGLAGTYRGLGQVVSLKDEAHDTGHLNDLDRHSAHQAQRLGQVLTEAWDKS